MLGREAKARAPVACNHLTQFLSVITSIAPFFLVAADHDTRRICVEVSE